MKFLINVCAGPPSQAASSALRFCRAALRQGHSIERVFFYSDGVYNANDLLSPPTDEVNTQQQWVELHDEHNIELCVCIAAAVRRGMLNQEEANRYDKPSANISEPFIVSGLGQLVEGAVTADRTMTFSA